ncbi:unnamed protein product [Rotaria sordida]|uniref:Uncharacterized protein n=1 Tax=Rotaria sordida TaxID=392033 RepID=A0A818VV47_9BILA|nr:unnamed protein product [Rotaria sordida]
MKEAITTGKNDRQDLPSLQCHADETQKDPNGNPTTGIIYYPAKNGYGTHGFNNDIQREAWDNYKYCNVYIQGKIRRKFWDEEEPICHVCRFQNTMNRDTQDYRQEYINSDAAPDRSQPSSNRPLSLNSITSFKLNPRASTVTTLLSPVSSKIAPIDNTSNGLLLSERTLKSRTSTSHLFKAYSEQRNSKNYV